MEHKDAMATLCLLSTLLKDQTISFSTMKIVDRNSWLGWGSRRLRRETKYDTVDKVVAFYHNVLHLLQTNNEDNKELENALINSMPGLYNLSLTYSNDEDLKDELVKLIKEVTVHLSKNMSTAQPAQLTTMVVEQSSEEKKVIKEKVPLPSQDWSQLLSISFRDFAELRNIPVLERHEVISISN